MTQNTENLIRSAIGLLVGALIMANLLLWVYNGAPVPPQEGGMVWCEHEGRYR